MQCEIWQLFCMLWRRGGGPSFCLLVFALHCFIVFWLSHRHPSAPMTHQDSILLSSALLFPSYPLFLCLSLAFQHNPRCLWKKKSASTADWSERHRATFSFLQTHSLLSSVQKKQKCKHDEGAMQKCSHLISRREKDKTRRRIIWMEIS